MWVKHLQGIFMRSQLFSFVYSRMVPQKTRTGLIQILAPIRLSVTHQEEFYQAWWAEQIKQLLPCSICRNEYWLLSHLGICDYRLSTYFPSTSSRFPQWKFPKYLVCFLFTTENDLLKTWNTCVCLRVLESEPPNFCAAAATCGSSHKLHEESSAFVVIDDLSLLAHFSAVPQLFLNSLFLQPLPVAIESM